MGTISNDGGDASGHCHKLVSSFSNLKKVGNFASFKSQAQKFNIYFNIFHLSGKNRS
jgi:hypothetical protein